jgi:hypothetical protein
VSAKLDNIFQVLFKCVQVGLAQIRTTNYYLVSLGQRSRAPRQKFDVVFARFTRVRVHGLRFGRFDQTLSVRVVTGPVRNVFGVESKHVACAGRIQVPVLEHQVRVSVTVFVLERGQITI